MVLLHVPMSADQESANSGGLSRMHHSLTISFQGRLSLDLMSLE